MRTIISPMHYFTALKCHRISALKWYSGKAIKHYRATAPPRRHRTAHTVFYYCPQNNTKHIKH